MLRCSGEQDGHSLLGSCLQVELSRWIGIDAIRASLYPKMRDAMKEDIDKAVVALQQLGIAKPSPERMTRKEQARLAAASMASGGAAPMEVDEETTGMVETVVVEEDAPDVSRDWWGADGLLMPLFPMVPFHP